MPLVLTEDNAGTTARVALGDTFDIVLPETPTTGYLWTLVSQPEGMVLKGEEDTDRFRSGTAPGASGLRTMTFRVERPGFHELKLRKRRIFGEREWDTDEKSTFVINIHVA